MSRIIVKNLPKSFSATKLEVLFSSKGCITDLQLKYNKDGVFRQFAFVGYKTEEEATAAKDFFDNTFVNTSRIKVDFCNSLGDPKTPKPWKKAGIKKNSEEEKAEKQKTKKSSKKQDAETDELMKDIQFKEFLDVHKDRQTRPTWVEEIDNQLDSKDSSEDDHSASESEEETQSLVSVSDKKSSSEIQLEDSVKETNSATKTFDDAFTVKIRNLPYHCKKKQIKQFFNPLKITSLRLPPKSKGFAFVKFKTEKDMKQALNKNKGYLEGHRVDVIKYNKKAEDNTKSNKFNQVQIDPEKNEELLAETGRIFVRNLCFTVSEEEIQELFKTYGPLAEVHVPIDFLTKKAQGFAFVSYMFAEHAVKAFSELDGTIFQGRLLHLIPAKPKKEYKVDENDANFKKKKDAKIKELSGSSHNWNILFMGSNAVADVISEKYNIEKSKLLSGDSKESVAVRMALAETSMVTENRKFLIDNGVQLDAFSQASAERSKNVIVVKHLPAKTSSQELNELFSKFGAITKVILPPSGVVALVEFDNATEAKIAFKKLAYSRFHHLPLYLEWAPIGAVSDPPILSTQDTKEGEEPSSSNVAEEECDNNEEPPPGTTIFVKNLSFDTTQTSFEKHFKQCGSVHYAAISTKIENKTGKLISMGFGFVQFKTKKAAIHALQNLQQSLLDGRSLELKFANREIKPSASTERKKYKVEKQRSAKILVRNVPFQASETEIKDLFKQFGALKFVRLPKKLGATSEHRGFCFVEYHTKDNAQRAFDALCHSTHLFNRRLVLEWANPEADDVDELRKKTARDFDGVQPKKQFKKSKLNEDVALASSRRGPED